MQIENKNNCTGCGACFNVCPKRAITMQGDKYGFYKPTVDKEKCIDCGLCEKICPPDKYKSENAETPSVFAFQNNDEKILFKCASGGAFALFAKHIIENNGIVYGVIYDEELNVIHSRSANINELKKMYSSKYVQSNTLSTFLEAKKDLEEGRTVLYSGTPCQIAGLKSYLKKDYVNLYTIDLVCHGVPSPLVFEKYKKEFMQNKHANEKILNINFRSKINGWSPYLITTTTTTICDYHIPAEKDAYMRIFLSNLSINSSCFDCKFNKLPRVADLTLADFWGVDEYNKSLNDNKGLSLILINNDKGNNIFSKIQKECVLQEIPLEYAIKYNPNISRASRAHKKREQFWNDIEKGKSLDFCRKKYIKTPFHIAVYRLLPKFAKDFIKYKIMKKKK